MDPKGNGMVVNDKEKESLFNEPRDDKPTDLREEEEAHQEDHLLRQRCLLFFTKRRR
jgi:hypothetical protein